MQGKSRVMAAVAAGDFSSLPIHNPAVECASRERIRAIRRMICSDTVEQREALWLFWSLCSSPTSRASMRLWRACLSPSVSWIPRCTSSCPLRSRHRAAGQGHGQERCGDQGHHRRPARVQPHDGSPGLPSGGHYPEIAAMQTRAVIKAALNVQAKHPEWTMVPEIMIPLVARSRSWHT